VRSGDCGTLDAAALLELGDELVHILDLQAEADVSRRRACAIPRRRRTLMPPCRFGGSLTSSVSRRGEISFSRPRSLSVTFFSGFFLAFMMLGSEA